MTFVNPVASTNYLVYFSTWAIQPGSGGGNYLTGPQFSVYSNGLTGFGFTASTTNRQSGKLMGFMVQ